MHVGYDVDSDWIALMICANSTRLVIKTRVCMLSRAKFKDRPHDFDAGMAEFPFSNTSYPFKELI